MNDYKYAIRIANKFHFINVQEKLFKMGYSWKGGLGQKILYFDSVYIVVDVNNFLLGHIPKQYLAATKEILEKTIIINNPEEIPQEEIRNKKTKYLFL